MALASNGCSGLARAGGAAALAAVAFSACGQIEREYGSPEFTALSDDATLGDQLVVRNCECQVTFGTYPTQAACVADAGQSPSGVILECIAGAYADVGGTLSNLACNRNEKVRLRECIDASACNEVAFTSCMDAYSAATARCPPLPWAAVVESNKRCYGVDPGPPFTCTGGEQIPLSWVCDAEPDCTDGSDEALCYTCSDGFVVPIEGVCNGLADCYDGLDEDCFACGSGQRILSSLRCDAIAHCPDGSDELMC